MRKVGIVGTGGIAIQHGIGWTANNTRAEIVAVADVSAERASAFSTRFAEGKARVYGGISDLLADGEVDIVDICLPHHLHTEAIIGAAEAGKDIFCEKPLCTTQEDAVTIGAALKKAGVRFMMAHNQLFQPSLIEARRLLSTGTLGRPFLIRSIETFQHHGFITQDVDPKMAQGESPWAWRSDPARMGGGEILDTGWHGSYRLLALAGSRPVEVTAMLDRFMLPGEGSEDSGLLVVRFEDGTIGEMLTSWAFTAFGAPHFEVLAQHGCLMGYGDRVAHHLHAWSNTPSVRPVSPAHTFTAEITHYLDVLEHGVASQAPFEIGARVLQLTKAAYKSAAEKRTISLPEDPLAEGI